MRNVIKNLVSLLNREIPTDMLIRRGLKVGRDFNRQQGCYIDPTHCYLIEIGNDVTMSVRVTLMAHDASTKKLTGYTRLGKIKIGDHVFIGANATILPGVSVGDYAVIGAGSVVTCDVAAGTVVAGVPARVVETTEELKTAAMEEMDPAKKFDASYRMGAGLTPEKAEEIRFAAEHGTAYIE